ncbi:MAG: ATP-binding protein [Verrucomicrobiae bacterium]|nr:ATP-binding protein [Verrucomicrobiae bacterium]
MIDQLELSLRNQPSEIARAQDELERFAARNAVPKRPLHDVQLALEEHLANLVRHAYSDDREHRIQVQFQLEQHQLRVEVEDDGKPFNPLEQPPPDLSLPLDQRPIGGLGLHMIRKSLDHVEYRRVETHNILVMIKRV